MKQTAAALILCLGIAVGNAQESSRGAPPPGPAPATEGKASRDGVPDPGATRGLDPTRSGNLTEETVTYGVPIPPTIGNTAFPAMPPNACG